MPIRVPRTALPQDPATSVAGGSGIAPVQAIGNPAAPLARTAGNAAQLAAQIYQEERDREVQTRVLELDIARRKADADVLGDYSQALGKDAVERRGEVLAKLQSNSKAVRAGIKDRAVSDAWKAQDEALTLAAQNQVDEHYRRQNLHWQANTQEARAELLTSSLERVALGEGWDPATGRLSDEAERTRSGYLSTIAELGAIRGWSPEEVEVAQRRADTQALGQVADSLIRQKRFAEASKVLERHGDRIDGGVRARLRAQVQDGSLQDSAAKLEREIVVLNSAATVTVDGVELTATTWENQQRVSRGQSPLPLPRARPLVPFALQRLDDLHGAGKISTAVRDATLARIRQRVEVEDAASDKARVAAFESAKTEAQQLRARSINELSPDAQESLRRTGAYEAIDLLLQKGGGLITDQIGRSALEMDPAQLRQFASQEALQSVYLRHLSGEDMSRLVATWKQANKVARPEDLFEIQVGTVVENRAREVGLMPTDGTKPNEEQQANVDRFREAVLRRANELGVGNTKESKGEILHRAAKEVAGDLLQTSSGPVPFLSASRDQQNAGWIVASTGRTVYARNIAEAERTQILEAIQMFNAEAAKRNRTLPPDQRVPLKPETFAQVVEEWEQQNVRGRVSRVTGDDLTERDLGFSAMFDPAIARAHASLMRQHGSQPRQVLASLQQIRGNANQLSDFLRVYGLTPAQVDLLLRFVDSTAKEGR